MTARQMPIAIVGLAGAFAQARDLAQYWSNILDEVDCITDVPESHWSVDDYYDPDPKAIDKTYCKRGGFIPELDFNPLEFGLPPNILEITDVSQLLSLVIAKQALADAGYGLENPHADNTGVVLGVSSLKQITPLVSRLQYPIWRRVLRSHRIAESDIDGVIEKMRLAYIAWQEDSFPGYLSNVVAGRITNRLDLGGINCTLDAACASSMASLQLAMHELQSGNCDMMITGGVDTNNTIMAYLSFSKTPAFTSHDHMRPFDAESDGMLIGEGIGMLVLKRLDDAEQDGNRIYAVIKGIGASSDGRSKSIYAPRLEGQELALRRALRNSGCAPDSIGLIEAHGTGTATGDPTEFSALRSVFGDGAEKQIAIGSVKSQIGHTKVAAGAASLIKAALALHHKILPATINIKHPHPKLALDGSPFYLNTSTRPWFAAGPRRAGVSSFGFGGTNFHAILEEYRPEKPESTRLRQTPFVIFLHARDGGALLGACEDTSLALRQADGQTRFRSLVEASKQGLIPPEDARLGFVASSIAETLSLLDEAAAVLRGDPHAETWSHPRGIHFRRRGIAVSGKLVALFSGQGSQYLEMGKALCLNFPTIYRAYEEMDALRRQNGACPISEVVFPAPVFDERARVDQSRRLQRTDHAQAAIGSFSLGLYRLLRQAGFTPDFVAGHSLGELTALCAADAISEADYRALLHARGQAMAQPPESGIDAGAMLAVTGEVDALEPFIANHTDVTIANRNSPSQLVLAGAQGDLEILQSELSALGNRATFLPVSAAFHSHRVGHAQAPFAQALQSVTFSEARIPVYSNNSGLCYPADPGAMRETIANHLVSPVNFRREIETIYAHGGRLFVEIGPGNVLTGLVGNILADKPHLAIAVNPIKSRDSDLQLRDAYAQLRVAGLSLTDIAPDQPLPPDGGDRPRLTVRLNGNAFVSEATKAAFESALTQDEIATPSPITLQHQTQDHAPQPEYAMTEIRRSTLIEQKVSLDGEGGADPHRKHLENMADYSGKYFNLMQQLYGLINNSSLAPNSLELFQHGMVHFHEQQKLTQQVHELWLQNQAERARMQPAALHASSVHPAAIPAGRPTFVQPSEPVPEKRLAAPVTLAIRDRAEEPRQPEPPIAHPVMHAPPQPALTTVATALAPAAQSFTAPAADSSEIASILLAVISEKTGYPIDTLGVSMDLDADLGIDSIKRVEIMAALEGKLISSMESLNFEKFAELRTIGQIADFLATTEKKTLLH
jgi:polyketide-type polyunsaturated fatty acid synthase PfaA